MIQSAAAATNPAQLRASAALNASGPIVRISAVAASGAKNQTGRGSGRRLPRRAPLMRHADAEDLGELPGQGGIQVEQQFGIAGEIDQHRASGDLQPIKRIIGNDIVIQPRRLDEREIGG